MTFLLGHPVCTSLCCLYITLLFVHHSVVCASLCCLYITLLFVHHSVVSLCRHYRRFWQEKLSANHHYGIKYAIAKAVCTKTWCSPYAYWGSGQLYNSIQSHCGLNWLGIPLNHFSDWHLFVDTKTYLMLMDYWDNY